MPPKKKKTFEQALTELEAVIEKLESDELTLDEALSSFEAGVKLIRTCEGHLRGAEGKLRELLKGEDGAFVEKVLGITLDSVIGGEEFDE
jgi:exodeoxyribonuclease VII small subunit